MKLPLYYIDINLDDDETGMVAISMVQDPAIEEKFLKFENEKLNFSIDDDKHCVFGPAIIPDKPIYRNNGFEEFNIVFTKDVIEKINEKYTKQNLWNECSLQHNGKQINAICVEHFIQDTERGLKPTGYDLPDGTLFTTFKILDDEIWNEIKTQDTINGFSIEIYSDLKVEMSDEKPSDDEWIEDVIRSFRNDYAKTENVPISDDSWIKDIIDSVKKDIQPTPNLNILSDESIKYAIQNRKVCQITYDGTSAKGYRQCAVTAYGSTIAGNPALRIWEVYGDSESWNNGEQIGGWRILCLDEINSFQVMEFMDWQDTQVPSFTPETSSGANGTLLNIKYKVR